jgi:hypothetical protein
MASRSLSLSLPSLCWLLDQFDRRFFLANRHERVYVPIYFADNDESVRVAEILVEDRQIPPWA